MTLKDIIQKLRGIEQKDEEEEMIDDDVTKDKLLRSLRREDRVMDEEEEKVFLKKKIAERRKAKLREHMFGIKTEIHKKQALLATMKKKKAVKILANERSLLKERSLLNNRKEEFRKTETKEKNLLNAKYRF